MADSANYPGARQKAAAWQGDDGKLYLFGGNGYDAAGDLGMLSDLWRYDPTTNNWTWLGGSDTQGQAAVYGEQGVAAPDNCPRGQAGLNSYIVCPAPGGKVYLFDFSTLWVYDMATGWWTWLKGRASWPYATYGEMGVGHPDNVPGGRFAATGWADDAGNFWLSGGRGYGDNYNSTGDLNDMWKYDAATGNWIWMKGFQGTTVITATRGDLGVPAPDNNPGRRWGSLCWTTTSGTLCLMGGQTMYRDRHGSGFTDDIWEFHPDTNNWAWVDGASSDGIRPASVAQGTPDADNTPGGRQASTAAVVGDKLYLFGGDAFDTNNHIGCLNDLWQFDPATSNWTWLTGSLAINQSATYGLLGVAAPDNTPGPRAGAASWAHDGAFWLFGGAGRDASGNSGSLNDLWKFEPGSGMWTWVGGSLSANASSALGTLGVPDPANHPGARHRACNWQGADGAFYVFGGSGRSDDGTTSVSRNDLWRYDPTTGVWTWIKGPSGPDQAGVYGEQGIADPANTPGARYSAVAWATPSGKLYLFGGTGFDGGGAEHTLADLWSTTRIPTTGPGCADPIATRTAMWTTEK